MPSTVGAYTLPTSLPHLIIKQPQCNDRNRAQQQNMLMKLQKKYTQIQMAINAKPIRNLEEVMMLDEKMFDINIEVLQVH